MELKKIRENYPYLWNYILHCTYISTGDISRMAYNIKNNTIDVKGLFVWDRFKDLIKGPEWYILHDTEDRKKAKELDKRVYENWDDEWNEVGELKYFQSKTSHTQETTIEQQPFITGTLLESLIVPSPQAHYDNSKGSLYKVSEDRGWNSYQFDIVKRIDRALKKGKFEEDLQKTKDLIDIWLAEHKENKNEN